MHTEVFTESAKPCAVLVVEDDVRTRDAFERNVRAQPGLRWLAGLGTVSEALAWLAAATEAPEAVAAAAAPAAPAGTAFEDKPAVRASRLARAPRRSRSEKMGPRLARRAASPELRRSESENGRRRRSSVTARDAQACWGMDDADEFRRTVEASIAKQTRFHREESLTMSGAGAHCGDGPAFTGALAVVE